MMRRNKLLLLIIFVAALIRFIGLIPNIDHTDESYIIKHSQELFYGIVAHGDFDPHAYKYGSLIFYFQALVYLPFYILGIVLTAVGISQPPPSGLGNQALDFIEYAVDENGSLLLAIGRGITAIFGTASVLLLYLLGKVMFNRNAGFLAAFILAVNPFHARDSHYITADVILLFFILLSMLFSFYAASTGRFKWYFLSGLVMGISLTIKYFPLALLAYPFAVLMDKDKDRSWLSRILIGILAIIPGLFIGSPLLFFSEESRKLLQHEVARELLWYGTPVTQFLSSFVSFIFSFGRLPFPDVGMLIPTEFTEFHSSFLTFRVFGPALLVISLLGIFVAFARSFPKTVFLLVVPLFNFVYISFYIPAVFERLSLPVVPFLCLFAAVFLVSLVTFVNGKIKSIGFAVLISGLIFLTVFYYPISASFGSSLSCSRDVKGEARSWIGKNISVDSRIAVVSPLELPPDPFKSVKEIRPDTEFFLSELQAERINYVFMNTGIFTRFTYPFENNFFSIPKILFQNYYVPLAMADYSSRAKLGAVFSRHPMCAPEEYVFFEIPKKEEEPKGVVKKFSFDDKSEIDNWSTEDLGEKSDVQVSFNALEGYKKKGTLEYSWNNLYYRGPRVMLAKIPVEGKVYMVSAFLKSKEELDPNQRDGFLRLDFYSDDDTSLPGGVVALSPRSYGKSHWQKTEVAAKAPMDAKFMILSLGVIGTKSVNSFYFDDIEILGGDRNE